MSRNWVFQKDITTLSSFSGYVPWTEYKIRFNLIVIPLGRFLDIHSLDCSFVVELADAVGYSISADYFLYFVSEKALNNISANRDWSKLLFCF